MYCPATNKDWLNQSFFVEIETQLSMLPQEINVSVNTYKGARNCTRYDR